MSNRLTFSLASLIVLIAFGLVFGTTSVMAEDPDAGTPIRSHIHPLVDGLADDPDTQANDAVTAHNRHPKVTSVALKTGSNISGTTAAVATGSDTFTLVITFDRTVESANNFTALRSDLTAGTIPLADNELTHDVVNVKTVPQSGGSTIAAPTQISGTTFEAVVTIGALPSGTADADNETMTFRVRVVAGAVFSLQTVPEPGKTVQGGASLASGTYSFTLVNELPKIKPTAPTGLTATAGDAQIVLGWADPKDSTITGYQVSPDDTYWADVPSSGATTTAYTVTGLTNGTEYTYHLRAVNETGAGASAVFPAATPTAPQMKPGAPILSATAGDQAVTLTWTTPTGDIDSYEYSLNEEVTWLPVPNSTAATTTYTVTTHADGTTRLSNGQNYSFTVRAKNAQHSGTPSNRIVSTPKLGPATPGAAATITGPDSLSCMPTGNRNMISVTFDEALKAGEKLAVGDIELTGKGWAITAGTADNTFNLAPKADRSWIGTTQVTVKVKANAVVNADNQGNTAKEAKFTVGPVLSIPANGYLVVVRSQAEIRTHLNQVPTLHVGDPYVGSPTVKVDTWDCMPDLGTLLGRANYDYDRGGRLIVKGGGGLIVKRSPEDDGEKSATIPQIGVGTVGVSEIMWAIDRSQLFGQHRNFNHAQEQWIELHNLNNRAVKVTLFDLETTETYPGNNYGTEIDRVSNFNAPPHGSSWPIRNANRGQDGDSDYGDDFVAMQRGPANTGKNYSSSDFDGRNSSKWTKATAVYLTRRALLANTGQLDVNNLNYDFIGTPGVRNNIGPDSVAGVTSVPLKPFIFNEIGNRSNRIYDWIELRNTSGAKDNLRNHQISIVTGVNNEVALFTFPNTDIWLEKDEVILVLATDPEDDGEHPIAVGYDVLGGTDQVPGLGPNPAKYIVASRSERLYTEGLPDGNFVLILRRSEKDDKRNAHAKLKTPDWILDVAGWDNDLGDRNAGPKYTALWPLNGHGAPFSKNNFREGKVYFRRDPGRLHGENNNDKPAFVAQGYTGVGYRRHAQNVPEHGGTPGYHDIRKNQGPSGEAAHKLTGGTVTISEIMFDTGDGRYPQWIELYNSSSTNAVNLHADGGWKLVIDNYDDTEIPLALISGTLNFKDSEVQTILPLQTVLVTSTRARSAGGDSTNASVVFIPTRVFSVWSEKPARDDFGMRRSTDPILSERAFHITLQDGKGNIADEVGNLTQSRGRVIDEVVWEWSEINAAPPEDGPRSSVIRRYREPKGGDSRRWVRYSDDEIMEMGVMAEGWIAAHETGFRNVRGTWYGDRDDIGSPGATGGRVLPVELSSFRPQRLDDGSVAIRWITESEKDNAGFNILRSDSRTGEFTKLNTQLIAGQGTTSERTPYEFVDKSAKPNVVYYYQIQDVSLDGDIQTLAVTHLRGHVSAAGKAATTWGELKALQ